MERVSTVGEVATAKTLARMLSATPPAANGIPTFCILDIHALQEVRMQRAAGITMRLPWRLP